MEYKISFVDASVDAIVDESLFPRRKPANAPTGFIEYVTQEVDLNAMFPTFNDWVFRHGRAAELNLFQAGRKQNFGFVERTAGTRHMIILPCKAGGEDSSVYLHCFDFATQFKHGGDYSWYSVVVLPEDHPPKLNDRYSRELERGFIELKVASFPPTMSLCNSAFPKLAALAGYRNKDKKVPRGWLIYQNKILRICSGAAATHKTSELTQGNCVGWHATS